MRIVNVLGLFSILVAMLVFKTSCNDCIRIHRTYYESGQVHTAASFYTVDGDTIISGLFKEYHEDGRLKTRRFYRDGKLDGAVDEYHPNGQLRFLGVNRDGYADSIWVAWTENGNMEAKRAFYRENRRSLNRPGQVVKYDADGAISWAGGTMIFDHYHSSSVCVGDSIEVAIYVAALFGQYRTMHFELSSQSGSSHVIDKDTVSLAEGLHWIRYRQPAESPGRFFVSAYGMLSDTMYGAVFDSIYFNDIIISRCSD